ncbi:MAG: BatA domain-containing protein [Sedimentisphaerales bacterium]|nr:BatA domain-containing protein [Sedimentisphaerales bacterium]
MNFAAWTFLFGIIAVGGPILAHFLAKPRFRRVPFTMLQFLKTSKVESHSRRHLRDLFILLLRCLIIMLIAFLFAQPFIFKKDKPKEANHIYYLGLDDSASMSYTDGGDTYFQQMKDSAIDYIVSSNQDSVFNICSLASGNWNYGLSKQEAISQVQSMKIKAQRADLVAFISGLNNSKENTKPDDDISAYLISDFTGNLLEQSLNIQEPAFVDSIDFKLISSSKPINNISITKADIDDFKNDKLSINVTIINNNATPQKRKLYAIVENEKIASSDISLNPFQTQVSPLVIEASSIKNTSAFTPIEIILSEHDNLTEDDKYYIAVQFPKQNTKNILLAETEEDEMFLFETAVNTISEKGTANKYNVKRIPIRNIGPSDLNWANIFVCPKIHDSLSNMNKALSDFINSGGRAIFFLTDEPVAQTAAKLSQNKVIPALPTTFIKKKAYLELNPDSKQIPGLDNNAVKALSNYRIDKLALKGCWDCQPIPESTCLWRYQNNAGFIYYIKNGNGASILVNSSIDSSLGSLLKSNAAVAICQCLIGEQSQIINYSFASDERIVLSLDISSTDKIIQNQISIENSNGQTQYVPVHGSLITIPESDRTGWIKTIKEPIIYAGVNLPSGETNMTKPSDKEIENAVSRIFQKGERDNVEAAEGFKLKKELTLWKYFAWMLIVLLLVESATANRMRR